jgi:hypothetical protein
VAHRTNRDSARSVSANAMRYSMPETQNSGPRTSPSVAHGETPSAAAVRRSVADAQVLELLVGLDPGSGRLRESRRRRGGHVIGTGARQLDVGHQLVGCAGRDPPTTQQDSPATNARSTSVTVNPARRSHWASGDCWSKPLRFSLISSAGATLRSATAERSHVPPSDTGHVRDAAVGYEPERTQILERRQPKRTRAEHVEPEPSARLAGDRSHQRGSRERPVRGSAQTRPAGRRGRAPPADAGGDGSRRLRSPAANKHAPATTNAAAMAPRRGWFE